MGDTIRNTNPGCKHFGSEGAVSNIGELPDDAGLVVTYIVSNNGPTYRVGDKLTKTLDQVEPVDEEGNCPSDKMKITRRALREITARYLVLENEGDDSPSKRAAATEKVTTKVGEKIADKLKITRGTALFGAVAAIGTYDSYSAWLMGESKAIARDFGIRQIFGQSLGEIIKNAATSGGRAVAGVGGLSLAFLGLAVGIPALAVINFKKIGTPESKIKTIHRLKGGNQALTPADFDEKDVDHLMALRAGETGQLVYKNSLFTGTPPPLQGYVLQYLSTGGLNDLVDMKNEGIVDASVVKLVVQAGDQIKKKASLLKKIEKEAKAAGIA